MKMSLRLTNVARITACIIKLVSYARGESLRERVFHVEEIPYIECRENEFDVREFKSFKYTANGKRQIQVENLPKSKMSRYM